MSLHLYAMKLLFKGNKMTDYKNIDTSEPKLSFAGMVCEGLAFVLAFLGLLVLITLLSAL